MNENSFFYKEVEKIGSMIKNKIFRRKLKKSELQSKLEEIDKELSEVDSKNIPYLFRDIQLDDFGKLLLDIPSEYSNIKSFFPTMPLDEVQVNWTGSHGITLLTQSLAFIKTLIKGYSEITSSQIKNAKILDYGCGWGRLIRLLYKDVPYENLYGVDPWDKSIDLCRQHGVKANLAICDYVPQKLPYDYKFDLIFAFSVFTHLSEKTTRIVLSTLRNYISENGVLVITIRPKEYWSFYQDGKHKAKMFRMHDENGYAFMPHNREPIDGDITYGDASITLGHIEKNFPQWELVRVITNRVDRYQKILFLLPAKKV